MMSTHSTRKRRSSESAHHGHHHHHSPKRTRSQSHSEHSHTHHKHSPKGTRSHSHSHQIHKHDCQLDLAKGDSGRRRPHRRAKKGRRNKQKQGEPAERQHKHHHNRKKKLILRPIHTPNAPRNSTQFIIEDHNSLPQFSPSRNKYNTRSKQTSRRQSNDEPATPLTPGNYVVNDDDYTLWAEFSDRDFQSVYEKAHQEEVATWDRNRLVEEITKLEIRQKDLLSRLAKIDPETCAQKLQSQVRSLQQRNRTLKSLSKNDFIEVDHSTK